MNFNVNDRVQLTYTTELDTDAGLVPCDTGTVVEIYKGKLLKVKWDTYLNDFMDNCYYVLMDQVEHCDPFQDLIIDFNEAIEELRLEQMKALQAEEKEDEHTICMTPMEATLCCIALASVSASDLAYHAGALGYGPEVLEAIQDGASHRLFSEMRDLGI